MIIAEWEGAEIVVDGDRVTATDGTVQRVLDGLMAGPAFVASSEQGEHGLIIEQRIRLQPGDRGHARAVLRGLAGIRFLVDDGDDLDAPD